MAKPSPKKGQVHADDWKKFEKHEDKQPKTVWVEEYIPGLLEGAVLPASAALFAGRDVARHAFGHNVDLLAVISSQVRIERVQPVQREHARLTAANDLTVPRPPTS